MLEGRTNESIDVILSLTRTTRPGYLRDVRRLTVALSRARLGLYILGRRSVFESCFELAPAFDILLKRSDKLQLVTGELWPSSRVLKDEIGKKGKQKAVEGETTMEGVEHLGQYVFEMTNAKVMQIKAERGIPENVELAPLEPDTELLDILEEDDEEEEAVDAFEGMGRN